jgi:hypothetical protein
MKRLIILTMIFMLFTGICSLQTSYATNISETVEKVMNADDTLDKNDNLKSTV